MDFGVLGLDGFVSSEKFNNNNSGSKSNNNDLKSKIVGSGSAKQERSSGSAQDDWRSSKIPRTDDFSVSKTMPLHQVTPLLRSNSSLGSGQGAEHMLCFSSVKSEPSGNKDGGGLLDKSTPNTSAFPFYHQAGSAYARSAGYGAGSLNGSMHGGFAGVRGPFTPSQWIELEHQALIYKYITANVPIPSNLLIPLKKSLYPFGLAGSSTGSFHPNSLGWGAFHLGYHGNSNDPEPGRCRRTDGKKWRCSRDAVADQKYCERHINRGRHRSRKPVEGQTGHAALTGTTNSKVAPMTTSVSTSVISSGGASNSLAITQQQLKNSQPAAVNAPADSIVNRAQDHRSVPIVASGVNLKCNESTFAVPKQDPRIQVVSQPEFGLVTSDSLLNPLQRSSYVTSKNYESFLSFNDQETQDQHNLRQFIDDWPKDQSSRSVISWPEELKSDWTQLSMSIPMGSSDFSSSSSSPTREKLNLSPLRLSRQFDPVQMGLGVSGDLSESSQKHTNWIPISWGTSMGGPLGEVLTTSTGNVSSCKSSAALNLLPERWDGSPQFGSSPTGVLQKAPFGSLSNSSSGSSPRAESKKNQDGSSFCDDVLGCTIVSSSSIASL